MCCVAILLCSTAATFGQAAEPTEPPPPPTPKTHPKDPMAWNVELMMEEAVLQISRRYNLNKAQEEYTRLLLTRRVRKFLEGHEDDVRQLLKESIELRLGLKEGTPEAYKDWAGRAAPVYEAAKKAIWDGNMEWGEILTPEQKILHKKDLDQMEANFKQVTQVMGSMKEGKGLVWNTRRTTKAAERTSSEGRVTPNSAVVRKQFMEANWLNYIERFIQTYKLDEKQQNAARAGIHKVMHAKARAHREKHKLEFLKIETELASLALHPEKGKDKREALHQRKKKLEKPIRDMFIDMHRRLVGLLRAEQRAKADPEQKIILDEMYKRLSDQFEDKKTAVPGATSRPDAKPTEPDASDTASKEATSKPATSKPAASEDVTPSQPKAKDTNTKGEAEPKAKKTDKPAEGPKAANEPPSSSDSASKKPREPAMAKSKE